MTTRNEILAEIDRLRDISRATDALANQIEHDRLAEATDLLLGALRQGCSRDTDGNLCSDGIGTWEMIMGFLEEVGRVDIVTRCAAYMKAKEV